MMNALRRAQWLLFFSLSLAALVDYSPRIPSPDDGFISLDSGGTLHNYGGRTAKSIFGSELCRILVKFVPDSAAAKELALFVNENSLQAAQLFVIVSTLMHAFAVPTWIVKAWETAMSAFFPFNSAILYLVMGRVFGAGVAYICSKLFLHKAFKNEERDRIEYMQTLLTKFGENKRLSFITRLEMDGDELFPQTFVNYAAPIVKISLTDIVIGSAIAALPQAATTVTNGRLYPMIYNFKGLWSMNESQAELIFIAAVLYFVPHRLCKALTAEFSPDLRTTRSWAKRFNDMAFTVTPGRSGRKSTTAMSLEAAGDLMDKAAKWTPRMPLLVSSVLDQLAKYPKALALPSWTPSLSFATVALALGDGSDDDYDNTEIDSSLKTLAQGKEDKLPGDHRHLLFEDVDPAYDGKYCPDLLHSDMRDSVTEVTPYSIIDKADSMGIVLDSDAEDVHEPAAMQTDGENLCNIFSADLDVPDERGGYDDYEDDDDDDCTPREINQLVHFYDVDDEGGRAWENRNWKAEMLRKPGSSCPYVNRLRAKLLETKKHGPSTSGFKRGPGPMTITGKAKTPSRYSY